MPKLINWFLLALITLSTLTATPLTEQPYFPESSDLCYPFVIESYESAIPASDKFFLDQHGYDEYTQLKATLSLVNPETAVLEGGFTLKDSQGNLQFAKLDKVFNLHSYKEGGPFRLYIELDQLVFDEGIVQYKIPFPSEIQAEQAYRKLLDIIDDLSFTTQSTPLSNSELAELAGFNYLVHSTRPENLVSILESGFLKPGNLVAKKLYGDPIGNHSAVFFTLLKLNDSLSNILQGTGNRMPALVFHNISILDNSPLHASVGFPYGEFVKYDLSDHNFSRSAHYLDPESFRQFVFNRRIEQGNEVMVYGEIPLKGLMNIIVKKGTKASYIKLLREKNIRPPNHLEWEDLFIEMPALLEERVPEYSRYSNHWLRPYSANSDDIVRYNLQKTLLNGTGIINQLEREYPGLKQLYAMPAQVWEGYTIKEHTLRVFKEFEERLKETTLEDSDYSNATHQIEKVLRIALALHDIGKGLGPKWEQHAHTTPILQAAMEKWGFRHSEISLAVALVNHDVIGEMLKPECGKSPEETLKELALLADSVQIELNAFIKLQTLFWISDASSYPFLKDNIFTPDCNGKSVPKNPKYDQLLKLAETYSQEKRSEPKKNINAPLFPLYLLEKEDPCHRYGLDLQNLHDKYENLLVQNPNWEWRGKFWEWLKAEGTGTKIPKVQYLSLEERKKYQATIKKGKIVVPFSYSNDERLLFGLDQEEHLYLGRKDRGSAETPAFFHSSFVAGEPVVSAGMMSLDSEGKIVMISDHSGHYRPGDLQFFQMLQFLSSKGIDLSPITMEFESLWEARLHKENHGIPMRASINAKDWFMIKNWNIYVNRSLQQSYEEIQGTQNILPSPTRPESESPTSITMITGKTLVVSATENKHKLQLIRERFLQCCAPNELHVLGIPSSSGYQTQAYNRGGELAALSRGELAEKWIQSPEGQKFINEHSIANIYWVGMANYIQVDSKKRVPPADYGFILIKNVKSTKTTKTVTDGVTIDPRYVEEAMRYGYKIDHHYGRQNYLKDRNWNLDLMPGNVLVGKVMTVHIYNLKYDDWHQAVSGKSRYDLLSEAFKQISIPN